MTRYRTLSCCLFLSSVFLIGQVPTTETSTPRLETPDHRPTLGGPDSTAGSGLTEGEIAAARSMVSRMDNWSPRLNQPANISIELRELRRHTDAEKTTVVYALYGTNIPKDKTFLLGRWPLGEDTKVALKGMAFNAEGRAICPGTVPDACGDPKKPNQTIELPVTAGRMEPVRFAILSEDKTIRAYTTAIPFPNAAKDGNCRLEVVLGVPDRELVMVQGYGFTAAEPIKIHQSDPPRDMDIRADPDGTFSAAVLHPLNGNATGNVVVKATGASCAPEITYDWGPNAYQKVKAGLD